MARKSDMTPAECIEAADKLYLDRHENDLYLLAVDQTTETIYKFDPEGYDDREMSVVREVEGSEDELEKISATVLILTNYSQRNEYEKNSRFVQVEPNPELATATEDELKELIDVDVAVDVSFDEL